MLLRQKMEALEARARKDAYHHQRLAEEVARFRSERGLPPDINVDEERRLHKKLEVRATASPGTCDDGRRKGRGCGYERRHSHSTMLRASRGWMLLNPDDAGLRMEGGK